MLGLEMLTEVYTQRPSPKKELASEGRLNASACQKRANTSAAVSQLASKFKSDSSLKEAGTL